MGDGPDGVDQVGVRRALEHVAGRARLERRRRSSARRRASRAAARDVSGACALISRAAWRPGHPRHRHVEHRDVRARATGSARPPRRRPRPRRPRCMPSWRSISMRRPERTMPWSSAIRMWSIMGTSQGSTVTVSAPGEEWTSARRPTRRARSAMPLRPSPSRRWSAARAGVEAARRRRERAGRRRCRAPQVDLDARRRRVARRRSRAPPGATR